MSERKMSSKERVQAALDHKEPDRIPLDLGSTKVSGISITALRRFIDYKGWNVPDEDPKIVDDVQQLARVNDHVLGKLEVDTRGLIPITPSAYRTEYFEDGNYKSFIDEWGILWRMPLKGGFYYDMSSHPIAYMKSAVELENYKWPNPMDPSRTMLFKTRIEKAKAFGEFAFIMHGVCAGVLEMALRLRGFGQMFMDLALEPDFACGLLDRIVEIKMAFWDRALDEVGSEIIVAVEADDLGTQDSLLISPEMYRRYIRPRHKKLFSFIKKKAPHLKVFLHSCGAIRQLIPELIEAGVDILNPIQVSARDMDTKALKREFGDMLTFWGGGIDTQRVLPFGTPAEVRDEVKRRIQDLAPGGGFVFNTVHNIQADVPPENIEAMLAALQEYGIY